MDRHRQSSWLPPVSPTPPPAVEPPFGGGFDAPASHKPLLKRVLGPLAILGLLILSWGAKLKGLLLLLPKLKLLTTSASMLVSIAAYALIWGWKFAVGFVALLFVHEMGHYIQLRREGVRPSGMVFIPFIGAAVGARSLGGSALAEARVGLAGPILGSLGVLALIPFAIAYDSDFLFALAFVGFFINLINLLPVLPLDGGRAMAAMAPWMWVVGFAALLVLAFMFPSPVMILVILFGGMETWRRWKLRRRGEGAEGNADYYSVAPKHRLMVFAVYILLIAGLAVGMDATFVDRSDYDF